MLTREKERKTTQCIYTQQPNHAITCVFRLIIIYLTRKWQSNKENSMHRKQANDKISNKQTKRITTYKKKATAASRSIRHRNDRDVWMRSEIVCGRNEGAIAEMDEIWCVHTLDQKEMKQLPNTHTKWLKKHWIYLQSDLFLNVKNFLDFEIVTTERLEH